MTVWERRDLPVLEALATSTDRNLRHGFLMLGAGSENPLGLDLSAGEVHGAVLALGDAGYVEAQVEYETGPGAMFTHLRVTGSRAAGARSVAALRSGGVAGDARAPTRTARRGGRDRRGGGKACGALPVTPRGSAPPPCERR